jgi:hypothetical protein
MPVYGSKIVNLSGVESILEKIKLRDGIFAG